MELLFKKTIFTPRHICLLTLFLCLILCSGCSLNPFHKTTITKQFPGGEPDDFEALDRRLAEEDTASESDLAFAQGLKAPSNKSRLKGLVLSSSVDNQKIKAGRPVRVNCLLKNDSRKTMPLSYTSTQRFDVSVFEDRRQTRPVHVWSRGKSFSMIYADRMLGPNAKISEIIEVPTTRTPRGKEMVPNSYTRPLLPGTYYLWLTHAGTPYMASGPIEINVIE
jgi:Intracellular proteinase inhibitor